MHHAVAVESRQVALDLHALLREIDPARWRDENEGGAQDRLDDIRDQLSALLGTTWPDQNLLPLQDRLSDLAALLREHAPDDGAEHWMALRVHAQPAYEALAAALREAAIHVPSLRPTNYIRNVLHVGMAASIICLVELVLTPTTMVWVSGGGFVWAWSMEISRRFSGRINEFLMRVFGAFAHPHETHRVNSATWYTTALLIMALVFTPMQGVVGLAVLGLGDPVAALVGRRFGRIHLVNSRTLEGTLAFFIFGTGAAMAVLTNFHPEIGLSDALFIAGVGSAAGALAELFTRRVDDNLAIPLGASLGATVATWLVL
jgi:dolichol kinase